MNIMTTTLKLGLATSTLFSLSVLVNTASANALAITGLHATGVDNTGALLPVGSSDPHYIVVETGAPAITVSPNPAWFPNSSTSGWIWQDSVGTPFPNPRTFRTTFDLTGLDPTTASIAGTWLADDVALAILINGQSIPVIIPNGFAAPSAFSINTGFISGINTLDFIAQDVGRVIAGFRVQEISGTADPLNEIPTPAVILPALAGLFSAATRRQNQLTDNSD